MITIRPFEFLINSPRNQVAENFEKIGQGTQVWEWIVSHYLILKTKVFEDRSKTDKITINCLNPLCEIREFHPSCLAVATVPKTWYCPNCRKLPEFKPKKTKANKDDEMIQRALACDSICICQNKALENDKLIECHRSDCKKWSLFPLVMPKLQGPSK